MDIESPKPTIVLVHGALEDSSIWYGVIPRLQRDGYPVIVFSNPLLGVAVDAAYLRSVLDRIEGPVILVSHAYGGAVITQAPGTTPRQGPCLRGLPTEPEGFRKHFGALLVGFYEGKRLKFAGRVGTGTLQKRTVGLQGGRRGQIVRLRFGMACDNAIISSMLRRDPTKFRCFKCLRRNLF